MTTKTSNKDYLVLPTRCPLPIYDRYLIIGKIKGGPLIFERESRGGKPKVEVMIPEGYIIRAACDIKLPSSLRLDVHAVPKYDSPKATEAIVVGFDHTIAHLHTYFQTRREYTKHFSEHVKHLWWAFVNTPATGPPRIKLVRGKQFTPSYWPKTIR
jgi:hypothetical protein